MLRGEVYDALDKGLIRELNAMKTLLRTYNTLAPTDYEGRDRVMRQILGSAGEGLCVLQPFMCDFGKNIHVGRNFYANFNLTILDEGRVTIGDNCFIGPNVGIYTPCHSTLPAVRNTGEEWALPVTIGDDCWIGGGVTILPGVTIGRGVTIGAGSVVTHDIPDYSVAVGNPCRVIKHLPAE